MNVYYRRIRRTYFAVIGVALAVLCVGLMMCEPPRVTPKLLTATASKMPRFVDSSGRIGDSSMGDDLTSVSMSEPVVRTLAPTGTQAVITLPSTNDPTTATYGLWSNELFEHNGVAPTDYWDKTMQLGYNYNGGRVDASQAATWLQWESNYYQTQFNNEFHVSTMGTDGIERRRYSQTSAKDGSKGEAGFAATTMTFLGWDGATLIAQLTTGVIQLFTTTQIDSADLHGGLRVKDATGVTSSFAVGTQDATLAVPIVISATSQPQLLVVNPDPVGTATFFLEARNGTRDATFSMGQDGNLVIENNTAGGAIFVDAPNQGFHFRNSSFADSLRITDSGDVTALGRVGATTTALVGTDLTVGNAAGRRRTLNMSAPTSASHGSVSADASFSIGRIFSIGSNTSTVLTISGGATAKNCTMNAVAGTYITPGFFIFADIGTPNQITFSCSTGSAPANCPDFDYLCWY